jgi:Aromatic-ring-opening dioxygenase LigAB, LigA subunit
VALGLTQTMSIYAVHKIAQSLRKDADFAERMRQSPAAAIAEFPLTDAERRAILSGDVGRLAQLGAHGYLLGAFAQQQVVGVTMANYVERIHEPGPI